MFEIIPALRPEKSTDGLAGVVGIDIYSAGILLKELDTYNDLLVRPFEEHCDSALQTLES